MPVCCDPKAFDLLRRHRRELETTAGLTAGAVAVAKHANPKLTRAAINRRLEAIDELFVGRVHEGSSVQGKLAHLHHVLFDELGLSGNGRDYYNPSNSYVDKVIKSGRGLPITLALVYKMVGERLGLRVFGVGMPGHFVAAVEEGPGKLMYVDPFFGGCVVSPDEARTRTEAAFGDHFAWSPEFLKPVSHRMWLTRLIQNLIGTFTETRQFGNVAAMLELQMLLWPDKPTLRRDLGLVLARHGMAAPASMYLESYLEVVPDDPQLTDLRELLSALGH
ncbi:MAG: SirB1 family protein [Phycisphaerae bacterium]